MAVSTINGVAQANVATVTGVTAANIATVNGVTFEAQWNLDWNNITGSGWVNGNTETSGKTGTLYIELSVGYGGTGDFIRFYRNGTPVAFFQFNTSQNSTESITAGDNLYFSAYESGRGLMGTITVKEDNAAGDIVDTFTIILI